MILLPRRLLRSRQPQGAARINWSHPLAAGLVFAAIPVGRAWAELVSGQITTNESNPAAVRHTRNGNAEPAIALVGNTGVASGLFPKPTGLDEVAGPFSIFVEGSLEVNASIGAVVISRESVFTGNGVGLSFDDAWYTTNGISTYVNNNSGRTTSGAILGADSETRTHRVMVTGDGTNHRYYANGALATTAASAFLPAAHADRRTTMLGSSGSASGSSATVVLAWDGVRTLEAYQELYQNPWQLFEPPRIWVPVSAGGGGTTFEQAVGGSLTLSGALRKQADKRTTGSLTATGVLWKQATKLVLGSLTPAGGLTKQTSKYPSGSLAAAGGLVKQTDKAAGGAITGTGSLQRQTNKGTSGSLTLVGLLSKLTSRTLTGSSAPVGAVRKLTEKTALTGSITGSGALATAAVLTHAIAGSITAVGALAKTTLKAAAGSIGLTGVLTKLAQKALSGSLTPQGALSRLTKRLVSGSVTPAGLLATSYAAGRALVGSITVVGSLGKTTLKRVVGSLASAGSIATNFIPGTPGESVARWFNKLILNVRRHKRRR